jgi:hypothetical protein
MKSRSLFLCSDQITCLVSGGAGVLRPASRARSDQSSVHVGRAQPNRVDRGVRVTTSPPRRIQQEVCVQGGLGFSFRGSQYLFICVSFL